MTRTITAVALSLALGACATFTGSSPAQVAEKVDTDAILAYTAIASSVNAYEAKAGADKAKAESIRTEAWSLLAAEHAVYKSGAVGDITALEALVAQAASLGK